MMKKRLLGFILSVCMLASGISINAIPANAAEKSAEERNIALSTNGTTVSTDHYSEWHETTTATDLYRMNSMIDGKNTTNTGYFVSSGTTNESEAITVTLTFNQSYNVHAIALTPAWSWKYEGGFPDTFKIEVQTAYGWETVLEKSGCTGEVFQKFRYEFTKINGTAIRLVTVKNGESGTGSNGEKNYDLRLGEFEVYGIEAPALSNVALSTNGTTVTASHVSDWSENYGLKLANINDGNTSKGREKSFFSGQNLTDDSIPVSVTLKFKQAYTVSTIRLDPAYTWSTHEGGFPEAFTISAFTSTGWRTIVTDSNVGQPTSWKTYRFPEVDCTAVRLTTVKNGVVESTQYGLRLGEFEVYGSESDQSIERLPETFTAVQMNGTAFASTSRDITNGDINLSKLNDNSTDGPWYKIYSSDFFSNPEGGQYVGVSFDQAYWFNTVTIATYDYWLPESFHISVYNGTEWVEVVRKTNYTPSATEYQEYSFSFGEICGSAVRVTADKMKTVTREGMTGYAFAIAELIINGAQSTKKIDKPSTELFNISSGMDVSAGSIVDWNDACGKLTNLTDNNRWTHYFSHWMSSADNYEWVQVTFDASMRAHYVEFYAWANDNSSPKRFPKDFEIQAYTGTEWKCVLSVTDYEITEETYANGSANGPSVEGQPFRFCFAPIECSAIRLVATELDATNTDEAYGLLITDMNVYGDNANTTMDGPRSNSGWGHQAVAAVVLSKGTNNELLNDGDRTSPGNLYTSELLDNENGTISMQFVFERPTLVDRIQFFPTDTAKFPTSFQVYAYTKTGWELIKSAGNYTTYNQIFSFKEVCCSSIVIQMTGLCDVNGKYGVQLKDLDIIGAIANDTGVVLGDGNEDNKLTEADLPYIRSGLAEASQSSKFDFNMDAMVDVRDLVRMKVYFASKD